MPSKESKTTRTQTIEAFRMRLVVKFPKIFCEDVYSDSVNITDGIQECFDMINEQCKEDQDFKFPVGAAGRLQKSDRPKRRSSDFII